MNNENAPPKKVVLSYDSGCGSTLFQRILLLEVQNNLSSMQPIDRSKIDKLPEAIREKYFALLKEALAKVSNRSADLYRPPLVESGLRDLEKDLKEKLGE